MRTIRGHSKRFTYITTFGHRIAATCDDNTVAIYDSVAGMLGLSLSPADPVQAMGGSPDGSVLFCRHQGPSVTLWDIQTGGLIHTFVLKGEAEDFALSSRGRYLACSLSDGSVEFSEVASKTEGTTVEVGSQIAHFCWMEPEERLAVAKGVAIHIWDVLSGEVLRVFTLGHPLCGMVHSQESNQLVIVTNSGGESAAKTISPFGGTSSGWYWTKRRLSRFAFSQATKDLVCGAEGPMLELFSILTMCWRRFEHPVITEFVSLLPSGFATANVAGLGIQLLSLDRKYSSPQATQLRPSAPTAHTFDQGKIIATLRPGCSITLAESTTTSVLLTIPTGHTHITPTHRTAVLCVSHKHRMAAFRFGKGDKAYLQLWEFRNELPKWTVETKESSLAIGGISPSGVQLVTFHDVGHQTHICMRDARNGRLQARLLVEQSHLTPPLEIRFESEGRFYSHHGTYRIPYDLALQEGALKILRHGQQPQSAERLPEGPYRVDDNMEWVVCGSKRVCWIPPGCIKSGQPNYSWAESTLVMYGQDGTSRMLTFRS